MPNTNTYIYLIVKLAAGKTLTILNSGGFYAILCALNFAILLQYGQKSTQIKDCANLFSRFTNGRTDLGTNPQESRF